MRKAVAADQQGHEGRELADMVQELQDLQHIKTDHVGRRPTGCRVLRGIKKRVAAVSRENGEGEPLPEQK